VAAPAPRAAAPVLLLFDIDGTLVLTGRAGARAMSATFESLFGVPDAFAGVPMGGRTDSSLLSEAFDRWNLDDTPDHHERFRTAYLPALATEIAAPGTGTKAVMPGVRALLDVLRPQASVHLALLTGNYHGAAAIKLGHFGLWDYFAFGAFADDGPDRNQLVPVAQARALSCGVPGEACARVVVIGDTPHDIACAAAGGARSVAVATGGHSRAELTDAGADVVLDDLSDTEAVVRLLL